MASLLTHICVTRNQWVNQALWHQCQAGTRGIHIPLILTRLLVWKVTGNYGESLILIRLFVRIITGNYSTRTCILIALTVIYINISAPVINLNRAIMSVHILLSQRTLGVIITSLLRQNGVTMPFWCNIDGMDASCVCWCTYEINLRVLTTCIRIIHVYNMKYIHK